MKKLSILLLFGLLFIISCGDNEIEEPNESLFGYNYFPVEVGYEWIYSVDSLLVIQGGNANKLSSSFVKDEITELIREEGEEKTYRLERSFRKTEDEDWKLTDIWTMTTSNEYATRTEENLRFIKLVFPAIEGVKWDGNSFFDSNALFPVAADNLTVYQGWSYKIESMDQPRTVLEQEFPQTLKVSHIDDTSFISKRFSEEFYARDIGLIERNMEIYETQNGNSDLDWEDRAESGFRIFQKLISFSK